MIQVFKLLKGLEDTDPLVFFETAEGVSACTRGHSLKLKKKQSNTSMGANAFAKRIINDWNTHPGMEIRHCQLARDELKMVWVSCSPYTARPGGPRDVFLKFGEARSNSCKELT